jgi:hypothetical protein
MAAIPAAITLARLVENIPVPPVAEAINQSYAKTPWNFSGGNREKRRQICCAG